MDIADEDSLQFEQLGYVVMSVEQYASYKAQHQAAFDAWYSNQQRQIFILKFMILSRTKEIQYFYSSADIRF